MYINSFWDLGEAGWGLNARGGQACLAQARQDRPGKGELDLTELLYYSPYAVD